MTTRFSRLLRLFQTVRHLKLRQIVFQLWYRAYSGSKPELSTVTLAEVKDPTSWIVKPACWEPKQAFTFLNEKRMHQPVAQWEEAGAGKLWLYNLHYFDCLGSQSALPNSESSYSQDCVELIADWVKNNTDIKGTGWEPYPASLRIVNWIKWHLSDSAGLNEQALQSLAQQTQWLTNRLEHHILANHLFANAKALVFAGLFFDNQQGARWLKKGVGLVSAELKEQVLEDGAHFELSPMYHAILLEDLLDLLNLANASSNPIDANTLTFWRETAKRMRDWQLSMLHPDGDIAFFNDAAFDIARTPQQIDTYYQHILGNGKEVAASLRDLAIEEKNGLSASGYAVLHKGPITVLADVAKVGPDYQPGHTHADTLSCEVSVGQDRLFVNGGTSTYVKGDLRNRQRATAAHNTLELAGLNSSDVWDGFRVARRAYPMDQSWSSDPQSTKLQACHNGYRHLADEPQHCREWVLTHDRLTVKDSIRQLANAAESSAAASSHLVTVRWLVHPEVLIDSSQILRTPSGYQLEWRIEGGSTAIEPAFWYPKFGVAIPTQCIVSTTYSTGDGVELIFSLRVVGDAPNETQVQPLGTP